MGLVSLDTTKEGDDTPFLENRSLGALQSRMLIRAFIDLGAGLPVAMQQRSMVYQSPAEHAIRTSSP